MQFQPLTPREPGIIFVEASMCLAILITSLVGNVFVCLSVYRNQRLRTTTNLYIIALAVADLLCAVLVMPFTAAVLISGEWIFGSLLCHLQSFILNFALFVSPTIMALTAFNRYIRIVKPIQYSTIFSKRRSRMMLGSAWVLIACYVAIPRLAGWQDCGFMPGYALCHVIHLSEASLYAHYSIVITLFLMTPLIVAIFCYLKVFKTIHLHNLDVAPSLQFRKPRGHITMHEIKVSKSLFFVVLAFVLCWIPAWSVGVMIRFRLLESIPRGVQLFSSLSIFMSSAVNPFIYAGMNGLFRREFKKIINCRSEVHPAASGR